MILDILAVIAAPATILWIRREFQTAEAWRVLTSEKHALIAHAVESEADMDAMAVRIAQQAETINKRTNIIFYLENELDRARRMQSLSCAYLIRREKEREAQRLNEEIDKLIGGAA